MRASDFRNATWSHVRAHLPRRCTEVFEAWLLHGPGTTRQVAERSRIDLLSLRPRTTELLAVGLLEVVAGSAGREGTYMVVPSERWAQQRTDPADGQQVMI